MKRFKHGVQEASTRKDVLTGVWCGLSELVATGFCATSCFSRRSRSLALAFHRYNSFCLLSAPLSIVRASARKDVITGVFTGDAGTCQAAKLSLHRC
jgi:hypothetical protein